MVRASLFKFVDKNSLYHGEETIPAKYLDICHQSEENLAVLSSNLLFNYK